MNGRFARLSSVSYGKYAARARALTNRWRELCDRYLPVRSNSSMWRQSRCVSGDDPGQGWKLHIAATVLNAHRVLERVAPLLISNATLFKAPCSLLELRRINSGVDYDYCQVGKIITVYPRTQEEAVMLARQLHRLTRHISAPSVPFDLQFRPGSNVYYRYGSFTALDIEHPDGRHTAALRDPQGNLVPDLRAPGKAKPEWVEDPFGARQKPLKVNLTENPLASTYRVFRALVQRGKGGVYQAIDLSVDPPRLCLIKEGRRFGEVDWDGRDGSWRVKHEKRVLSLLRDLGIDVPRAYSSFTQSGNYYVVYEFIDGMSLHQFLWRRKIRLSIAHVLRFGIQLATLIAQIHAAGWIWRDCKPTNLLVTTEGHLRPLDFEGACPVSQPDPLPWVTPAFSLNSRTLSGGDDDLYALGAVIYLLLTGRMLDADSLPVRKLRRNTPSEVCKLVSELTNPAAQVRPVAADVAQHLRSALSHLN